MRNTRGNGKVVVSRSTDGGATWSDPIDTTAPEVYCQLSVLYYDKNGTGGKDRVTCRIREGQEEITEHCESEK